MADNQDAIELQRRARRRLVGAIALVVFVVIVLPIVFDREPKPITQDLTIQIPSQDAGRFSSRVLPPEPRQEAQAAPGNERKAEPVKAASEASRPAEPPAVKAEATSRSEKAEEPAKPVDSVAKSESAKGAAASGAKAEDPKRAAPAVASTKVASSEPAKAPDTKAPESKAAEAKAADAKAADAKSTDAAKSGNESYVIALGLFRNPDNVKKVRAWVTSAGYKSFTEAAPPDASGAKGVGVKVLAGPFPSKDAAEKAREKLKAKGVDVGAIVSR